MILDYQCVTEEAVASSRLMKHVNTAIRSGPYDNPDNPSRLMKARQHVTAETRFSIIRGRYRRWPPMNSRMMDVGGIADISSGDRATM